jgi:uncharacterized sulfatase
VTLILKNSTRLAKRVIAGKQMLQIHFFAAIAAAFLLLQPMAAAAPEESAPNIVIVIADDFSQLDSEPWGSTGIKTPAITELAAQGLSFDRAYVASPSCAPSRAALLTGLMPARNGAESNHARPRPELRKLPSYLQELGYETAAFGKVSHYRHTADYGFDHYAHDGFHDHAGIGAAVQYLEDRDSRDHKPVCLLAGSNWPHVPWPQQTEGIDTEKLRLPAGSIDTPKTRIWRARYAAAVESADRDLRTIMDAAKRHLSRNTIFIFTSDHGAQWPFAKWNLYESGIRVPMIISWPDRIPSGQRSTALISWVDILPTLVDAAGGSPPAGLDGHSFLPVLMQGREHHHKQIFALHSNDNRMNVYPARSVTELRWKYIRNLHPENAFTTHIDLVAGKLGQRDFFSTWEEQAKTNEQAAAILRRYHQRPGEELYDLEQDPFEEHNLADSPVHRSERIRLSQTLDFWMAQQGDQQLQPVTPRLISEPGSWGSAGAVDR